MSKAITIQQVHEYYEANKKELNQVFKEVNEQVEGRICHTSILLLKIVSELTDVERYMEIGVHNGGSMGLLISNPKLKYALGLDLFEDMYDLSKHLNASKFHTYQYFQRDNLSQEKTESSIKKLKEAFGSNAEIKLTQGNSYFDSTENQVKETLKEQVDLLHIDGDHTWDGVQNDFKRYSKFVAPGGYIVFDDYHMPEIKRLIHEVIANTEGYTLIGSYQTDDQKAEQYLVQKDLA